MEQYLQNLTTHGSGAYTHVSILKSRITFLLLIISRFQALTKGSYIEIPYAL